MIEIKLSQIKANEANPRSIKDERFTKLVNSVLVFPKMLEIRPIVIDNTFVALGGNMRYRALTFITTMDIDEIQERLRGLSEFDKKTTIEQKNLIEYWETWLVSPTVHAINASNLSDEERRAFIIKDNIGYGEWDSDILSEDWELEELSEWGLDLFKNDDEKKDFSDEIIEEYRVEVLLKDEVEQEKLFNRLTEEGYDCRILNI